MDELILRAATAADLPAVAELWYVNQFEGDAEAPPMPGIPSLYPHELATGELQLAERDGEVLGFAGLVERDGVAFLADMFVRPSHQSAGVGRRLLERLRPRDGRPCCLMSSSDPRALGLYVRAGLTPRWPHIQLMAPLPAARPLPTTDLEVLEAEPGDPELVRWDAEVSGRRRPQDHAYWLRDRGGIPLWFARRGEVVGYGYAQTVSDDLPWQPDTLTLGPIGARAEADAAACVLAAARWAQGRAPHARIPIPGPHPALPALLEAGFRIAYVETFCANDDRFVDALRYLSSGSDLF